MKLQRTFVLIYTIERRVQGNIAQKNMQDMLQLKILGHDENLSKIARKKYVRTANLKMPSGKVEICENSKFEDAFWKSRDWIR